MTCQNNKYERKPIQMDDDLTQTPCKPFQKINVDNLTLERKKYLTLIDQFSKFAQIPNKVQLKVNVRNIQKVKKPLHKSQDVVE